MPKPATKTTDEFVAEATAPFVAPVVPPMTSIAARPNEDGYYGDAEWVRLDCGWENMGPREGFAGLWAEFDVSLTFAEANAIPDPFRTPFSELGPYIYPRVRAWNCVRRNPETGDPEPIPPPCEIGIDAFYDVRPNVMAWLAFTLKTLHLGGGPNRKNETAL